MKKNSYTRNKDLNNKKYPKLYSYGRLNRNNIFIHVNF